MTPEERLKVLQRDVDLQGIITKLNIKVRKKRPITPEQRAILDAGRKKAGAGNNPQTKAGINGFQKLCRKCNRTAVRGLEVCYFHGGRQVADKRKMERGIIPNVVAKNQRRNLNIVIRMQEVPYELAITPVYQRVWTELNELWTLLKDKTQITKERMSRRTELQLVLYQLIVGWTQLEIDPNNAEPWTRAVQLAHEHGCKPE